MNAPIVPVANFQRDGAMTFVSQGNRPNYQSSISPLSYQAKKGHVDASVRDVERQRKHENFVNGAWRDLSEITERGFLPKSRYQYQLICSGLVDFEQPRALWHKVWTQDQRKTYISNVSGHFGQVKSNEVKARQRRSSLKLLIELLKNFFSICLLHCFPRTR